MVDSTNFPGFRCRPSGFLINPKPLHSLGPSKRAPRLPVCSHHQRESARAGCSSWFRVQGFEVSGLVRVYWVLVKGFNLSYLK